MGAALVQWSVRVGALLSIYAGGFAAVAVLYGGTVAGQWVMVTLIVVLYSCFLAAILTWEYTRGWVVGFAAHRPGPNDEPVYLPWAVAAWALATAGVFAALCEAGALPLAEAAPASSAPPKLPGALGSAQHAFWSAGWRTGIAFFGVTIDTWWEYSVVCVYQLTRAVLGSMVANIFTPFYGTVISSDHPVSARTKRRALLGRALTSVFTMWSMLTDILLSATQADLFAFTVFATVCADIGYCDRRIAVGEPHRAPPPPPHHALAPAPAAAPALTAHTARRRSRSPADAPRGAARTHGHGAVQIVYS